MVVTIHVGAAPLVGRAGPLAELGLVLNDARASRGRVVLVTGAAGIGKTRLAEEACALAEGFRVVWCSCGGPGDASLHPWSQLARALAANDARVSRLVARSRSLSAGRRAEDPESFAGAGTIEPRWTSGARGQLFDDILEILEAAAASEPLLVVFDDVHAAGPSALQVLGRVAAALRTIGVVVLGTARDDTAAWRASADLRGTVVRHARRVELESLSDADVGELVGTIVGDEIAVDVVPVIAHRTGGNPLLVVELVRFLGEGTDVLATKVPSSVRAIVAERTETFPADCRRLLAVAAVVGTRFRLDVLAAAADVELSDVRSLFDDPEQGAMLSFGEPGSGRFTHDLVRDAVYEAIAPAERERLHERVASALAVLAERGRGVDAVDVARHLLRAGPAHAARAAEFTAQAGDDARRVAAYEDAVRWYEQTIACLDLSAGDTARRCEALLALGEARSGCGDRDGARREFLRAATAAQAADLPTFFARAALGVGSGPAGFEVDVFDREQIDLLEEARTALPAAEQSLASLVTARLSVALTMLDAEPRRLQLAQDAVALAREALDDRALVYGLSALCDAQAGPDHCRDRLRYTSEMLDLVGSLRDVELELLARRLRIVALLEVGDLATADAEMRAFRARAEELRHPLYTWYVPLWQATRALIEGRFSDCEKANLEAETLGRRAGSSNARLLCLTQRWCLLAERGDQAGIEAMLPYLEDAPVDALWMHITTALVSAQLGRLDDARRRLDAIAPTLPTLPRDSEWIASLAQVAETVSLIGSHSVSTWVYDALLPYAGLYVVEGIGAAVRGPVDFFVGLLASERGDQAAANSHFEAALTMGRAIGATELIARVTAASAVDMRATRDTSGSDNVFRREGELWRVRFDGAEVLLPHAKGLHDVAQLLAVPGREIAALDLTGGPSGGDLGPVLDPAARDAYRERLVELDAEIDQADSLGDVGRAHRLVTERAALVEQLTAAFGLGGRARRAGSPAERARTTATARIRAAIRRVEAVAPELGRHLDRSVRTGTFCAYRPDPPTVWNV